MIILRNKKFGFIDDYKTVGEHNLENWNHPTRWKTIFSSDEVREDEKK